MEVLSIFFTEVGSQISSLFSAKVALVSDLRGLNFSFVTEPLVQIKSLV